jgi:hypothetical protein
MLVVRTVYFVDVNPRGTSLEGDNENDELEEENPN